MSERDEDLPPLVREILEPEPPEAQAGETEAPPVEEEEPPPAAPAQEPEAIEPLTDEDMAALLGLPTLDELVLEGFDELELQELEQLDPDLQEATADTVLALLLEEKAEEADPLAALQEVC